MRLIGGAHAFFCGRHRWWNTFETVVVMLTLLDVFVLLYATQGEMGTRATMVCRAIRLVRLTRVTRLARIGLFHELTFMLRGVESGRSTLLWGFFLVVLISYAGGVGLTQTIGRVTDAQFSPYVDIHFRSTVGLVCLPGFQIAGRHIFYRVATGGKPLLRLSRKDTLLDQAKQSCVADTEFGPVLQAGTCQGI